jgi:Mu transposase, C-terminal
MPTDNARVTAKGIKFKGGYYTSATAERSGWFVRARLKGEWSIKVSYDLRNLDKLYIRNSKLSLGYETCRLLGPYLDLKGKTLFEYEEKERRESAGGYPSKYLTFAVAEFDILLGRAIEPLDVSERVKCHQMQ